MRPLTKTSQDGELYSRPMTVVENIESAIGIGIEAIRVRIKEENPQSESYLKSESLVYLFREARRNRDDAMANLLATELLIRCESILQSKLTKVGNRLHEDILAEFAVILANDDDSELDYYEVRFNHAFRTHRLGIVRTEVKRCQKVENQTFMASANDEEEEFHSDEPIYAPTESDELIRSEVLDRLPPEIQKAVVLREMGYAIESRDSSEDTVATICGVRERTIHNWIKKAQSILKSHSKEST